MNENHIEARNPAAHGKCTFTIPFFTQENQKLNLVKGERGRTRMRLTAMSYSAMASLPTSSRSTKTLWQRSFPVTGIHLWTARRRKTYSSKSESTNASAQITTHLQVCPRGGERPGPRATGGELTESPWAGWEDDDDGRV